MVNVARCAPRNARHTACNTGNRSTPDERDLEEALGQLQPQVAACGRTGCPSLSGTKLMVMCSALSMTSGRPASTCGSARSCAPRCPIFSYCDKATFGITGDRAAADVLARGIADGLVQLAELAAPALRP